MWTCKNCGEALEDNFDACWNCQSDRYGSPISDEEDETELLFEPVTELPLPLSSDLSPHAQPTTEAPPRRSGSKPPTSARLTAQHPPSPPKFRETLEEPSAGLGIHRPEYLVVPFVGHIKRGLFSSQNAHDVSMQLQAVINEKAAQGWYFYSMGKVDIEVAPGCLLSLLGARSSVITFDQLVFRR